MRRTRTALIYKQKSNLRAAHILLGHTKIETTVRYLGVDIKDALDLAEVIEVCIAVLRAPTTGPTAIGPNLAQAARDVLGKVLEHRTRT